MLEIEIVQFGDGLYAVCRRHCPDSWPEGGAPDSLSNYAHEVARINNLYWSVLGVPRLDEGQQLWMPPCPW